MAQEYLEKCWDKAHEELKLQNNYRKLFFYSKISHENKINFSSNDYLNLSDDPRVIEAGHAAALQSGAGNRASRSVLQGDGQIEFLESYFAQAVGFSHSLFFASGFLANISFFDVIAPFHNEQIDQEIFIDHRAHASLFYGLKQQSIKHSLFRHHDYHFLEKKLARSQSQAKIIVVESLYSMDGDYSHADILCTLCEKYNAVLFIDESHSFGICGPKGSGWINQFPQLKKYVLCAVYGCGKSVGVSGGFLATNSLLLRERILQKSKIFIYSTGISPFITGAVCQSLQIIFSDEGHRKRTILNTNINFLQNALKDIDFPLMEKTIKENNSPIFSLVVGKNETALQLEQYLFKNNIIVKAIRPPSVPQGSSRIRIVLNCQHTPAAIESLLRAIPLMNETPDF